MTAPVATTSATGVSPLDTDTQVVCNKPASTVDGDLLIAIYTVRNVGVTMTAPAGWTLIRSNSLTSVQTGTFWKIAASEPASYTFSRSPAGKQALGILRITGAHPFAPIDLSSGGTGASSLAPRAPLVNTNYDDSLLVAAFGTSNGAATVTNPAGMSSQWAVRSAAVAAASWCTCATLTLGAAGVTSNEDAASSAIANYAAQQIIVVPATADLLPSGWGLAT